MIKKYLLLLFLLLISINNSYSLENKIKLKIDNKIITSLDIRKEIRYLKALNPQIRNLEENRIYQISKNSILKETIKKNEILKNIKEIQIKPELLNQFIKQTYVRLGINSKSEFISYLDKESLNIKDVETKIGIEIAWNRLVYLIFSSMLKINEDDLKKKILENKKKDSNIYYLQEILFEVKKKSELNKKYNLIKKNIETEGFEKSALTFSISDSSSNGGSIGWVDESSLNPIILESIKDISVGNHTNPIVVSGGFLILKVKEIKTKKKEVNVDEELSKLIVIKTNEQLNQFSQIFYNKIKNNSKINEY